MSAAERTTAIRAIVRGRVQGVGFRDTTVLTARGLGVTGWVRNEADGSVLVHAEGPERARRKLLAFLRQGPPAARVSAVEVVSGPADGYEDFMFRGVSAGSFVVQEHAATRRHFDLRLEVDGVMRSWAVPSGPSLDPAVRCPAIQVPDHTMADARFEGPTPHGGVIVWDRGNYEQEGLLPWPAALDRGHATFLLHGQKLRGGFALRRLEGGRRPSWELTKRQDEHARPGSEVTAEQPRSVVGGLTLDEVLTER